MSLTSSPRALLTGATGFLGRRLTAHLEAQGWATAALIRSSSSGAARLPGSCQRYPYSGHTEEVLDAVADFHPQVVFHLASLFVSSHGSEQIEPLVAANILLGTQLLEAMRASRIQALVNAGTSWQSFLGRDANPVNLYAATKQSFESLLSYYVEACGLHAVTLRLYDNYGPGDERPKLLRLLLQCLRTGETLRLSGGEQVLDLVHVDDVCRALLRAAELAPGQQGAKVYAVSGGERHTLREIVALLGEIAGRAPAVEFGALPYREREVMVPWVGPPLPGWEPQVSLQVGLGELLAEDRLPL